MKIPVKILTTFFMMGVFATIGCSGGGGSDSESSDKAITVFAITSPAATGAINESAKTITVTVPYVPSVAALIATFTTTGSTVQVGSTTQVSGTTANDFTNPVIYIVTAEDNSIVNYTVTVTVECAVIYNGNGNTDGTVPVASAGYNQGSTVTVALNTGNLLKINTGGVSCKFDGWNTQADGSGTNYVAGSGTFVINSNITLYVKWTLYALRDVGPAGGLIFYDKGSYSDGWRYMEVAPADQSTGIQWSNGSDIDTGATATAIGNGFANTNMIIVAQGVIPTNYAAGLARVSNVGGYSDWFLPSKDELAAMYTNLALAGVGSFTGDTYWSSSEGGGLYAWTHRFSDGVQNPNRRFINYRVRAARSF
jgi:hypothetical protein